MPQIKAYLGDAVYAEFIDEDLVLTTENGLETTNKIFLDPNVLAELLVYIKETNE